MMGEPPKGEQVVLNFKVPKGIVEEMDKLIEKGYYQNRSDFLRTAIRLLLREHDRR